MAAEHVIIDCTLVVFVLPVIFYIFGLWRLFDMRESEAAPGYVLGCRSPYKWLYTRKEEKKRFENLEKK